MENENIDKEEKKYASIAEKLTSGKIIPDPSIASLIKYFKDLETTEDNLEKAIGSYINNFEI